MKAHRRLVLGVAAFLVGSAFLLPVAAGQVPSAENPPAAAPAPDPDTPDTPAPAAGVRARSAAGGLVGPDYEIGPEDVVVVEVFNLPEMRQVVRVENDGTISVKLLGRVKVVGLTAVQLEKELERDWGKDYLEDPHVTVFIREAHSQPVSVVGAVEAPGIYQLTGHRTVVDMVALAGGLLKKSSGAAGRTIYVTRKSGFGDLKQVDGLQRVAPDQVRIDLRKLLYSNDTALNVEIKPFDIISVAKADIVYVVGAVKTPGGFLLEDRDSVTVLQALAMAQGFLGSPAKSRTRIIRRLSNGSVTEIPIDIGKIMRGKADDVELSDNDILMIPDSAQKMAGKRSAEAVIGTISGLLIYGRGL
jgi:polysaccharide export outer membrane protein